VASLGAELAMEEAVAPVRPRGRRRPRWWRVLVLALAAIYFLIPLYAGLKFTFEDNASHFSFVSVTSLPHAQGFAAAFWLSMRLAAVTVVIAALVVVPTTIYVHLRLPRLRRVLEFVTILPIVIPPIVLILGVLNASPIWVKSSAYLLSFEYVVLALPFIYRSLDAGLGALDLKTLIEAARSLGASWVSAVVRVILPNLRAAILSATVLTMALVLGEYTMSSLDGYTPIPVWLVQFRDAPNGHEQIAAAMLGLIGTWALLTVIVSLDRSGSRRRRETP
jgi:putative spermidine/putrescine transport system permease protein